MKNNQIKITNLISGDVSTIKNLEKESGLSVWKELDYINEIERNDSFCKKVKIGNTIGGFILARLITSKTNKTANFAEIYNIGVEKKFRKKGIGSILLKDLINSCIKHEILEILLEVRRSNTVAQSFYTNHGFEQIAERKNYYYDPPENAIIMKRDMKKC